MSKSIVYRKVIAIKQEMFGTKFLNKLRGEIDAKKAAIAIICLFKLKYVVVCLDLLLIVIYRGWNG